MKVLIRKCINCGRYYAVPESKSDGWSCPNCGGYIAPIFNAETIGFFSATRATQPRVLYECDRRACKSCPDFNNGEKRCSHTADITHAKNFINIDGGFWETPPSEKTE